MAKKKDNTLNYALIVGGVASAMFIPIAGMIGLLPASYGAYKAYKNNKAKRRRAKSKPKKEGSLAENANKGKRYEAFIV